MQPEFKYCTAASRAVDCCALPAFLLQDPEDIIIIGQEDLRPLAVMQGHRDWVFGLVWLDHRCRCVRPRLRRRVSSTHLTHVTMPSARSMSLEDPECTENTLTHTLVFVSLCVHVYFLSFKHEYARLHASLCCLPLLPPSPLALNIFSAFVMSCMMICNRHAVNIAKLSVKSGATHDTVT